MSHIVQIDTQVRDVQAVQAACQRLELPTPLQRTVELFSGQVTGLAIELPDWRYPVVCNLTNGQMHYDNFEGRWGPQNQLDRFLQAYAVEKCRLEARRHGHQLVEQPLSDGSIRLTIQLTGGAP